MNIRDLEYLVALAEHRHFRRAADSCHVSQPTLSGQIRKLEDELGVMLLERTSRKVLFTQAGMLLVDQARTVLREVKVLKEMASQQGETMSGPLHIGLIPTVGPYLLPHIIPMLHQTFPKLEMYLHEAQTHQLLAQLDSGKLDCVILALVKESEAFIEVPLFDEPMLLAIYEDHPWANRECVPMADLAGEKLLMLEDGHCLRDQAMGFCFEAGADEDTHFRATSLETLRNMVAAGSGITLLPALAVPPERKRDGVVYLPCIKPEPRRTIGLVYRPGSPLRSRYEQLAEAINKQKAEQLPALKEERCTKALAERVFGEVPVDYVTFTRQDILRDFYINLQQQGVTLDQFFAQQGITADEFNKDLDEEAKEVAAQTLALDALYKHLELEITDEDIDKEFQVVDDPAAVRKQWEDNGRMSELREAIRRRKATEWLIENAVVTLDEGDADEDEN